MKSHLDKSFCNASSKLHVRLRPTKGSSSVTRTKCSETPSRLNTSTVDKSDFRIRPSVSKVVFAKEPKVHNIFANFDIFMREMIEKEEDISSENALYLRLLSEYLGEDIEKVRNASRVEFIADTTNMSLQPFGEALESLTELKLNGSVINSIKDVGTSFKKLKVLWISRVGLKELSGLAMFPSLEELYASYNFVSDISDIEYLENLHTLDLEANNIAEIMQLTYLSPNLKHITLIENKVAENKEYTQTLLKYGKHLESIDNVSIKKDEPNLSITPSSTKNISTLNTKESDNKLLERFRSLGVKEDVIKKSIKKANSYLQNDPLQDEILKLSTNNSNTKKHVFLK